MLTSAKPDLDAYNSAMTMSTAELVTALRDLLGAKLVAYLGRVKETRAVRQWAEGTRTIANPTDVHRLRVAYRAAAMITARAVRMSPNPGSRASTRCWMTAARPDCCAMATLRKSARRC